MIERAAREGQNQSTGEKEQIPAYASAMSVQTFPHLGQDVRKNLPYLNVPLRGHTYTQDSPSITFASKSPVFSATMQKPISTRSPITLSNSWYFSTNFVAFSVIQPEELST